MKSRRRSLLVLQTLLKHQSDPVPRSLADPQDWDARLAGSVTLPEELITSLAEEASEWRSTQDGQRILTTTPSVLGGCRAQVYRAAGATQWYTAVIVGFNENTGVSGFSWFFFLADTLAS